MQIETTTHEAAVAGNFQPTDHRDIFIDAEAGKVAIIQPHDKAMLITVD